MADDDIQLEDAAGDAAGIGAREVQGAITASTLTTISVFGPITATMQVSQLLKIGRGAIIELDTGVGDPVDILANQHLIARGEVVVVDDHLAVSLTKIMK